MPANWPPFWASPPRARLLAHPCDPSPAAPSVVMPPSARCCICLQGVRRTKTRLSALSAIAWLWHASVTCPSLAQRCTNSPISCLVWCTPVSLLTPIISKNQPLLLDFQDGIYGRKGFVLQPHVGGVLVLCRGFNRRTHLLR